MLIGASSGAVVAPTLTIGSTTNYNQNSAVFNATVNTTGNRNITLVEFQYSRTADFSSLNSAWLTASTNSTIAQGATSTATTCNASSLPAEGTVYYVRFRVTNSSGFVTTSSIGGSFTTYSLKAYQTFNSSSTWSNPRTTSGTSGLAITSIQDLLVVGGGAPGAGDDRTGGGGGGGAVTTSASISVGSSVVVTIGAGGSGYYGFGATLVTATASSIAGTTTVTANPGGYAYGSGSGDRGGDSGNGYSGGLANGYSGGGGGGAGGAGNNAPSTSVGGNGGAGVSGYGGGGGGSDPNSNIAYLDPNHGTPTSAGPANTGQGGAGIPDQFGGRAGGSGYAQFRYYGP